MKRLVSMLLLFCMLTTPLLGAGVTLDFENQNSETGELGTANEDVIVDEYLDGEVNNFLRIPDPSWDGESEKVYITNWPSKQSLYGTVLVSLNNQFKIASYKPKFSEVSFIKDRVINGLGIPAVYTDSFDSGNNGVTGDTRVDEDVNTEPVTLDETRETSILGGDILTLIDKWDETNNCPYVVPYTREAEVPKGLAIQACAKALGAKKYSLFMKTRAHEKYETMPVTKTPFVTMVSSNDIHVDCSKYYTDVYISRSMPEVYWEAAHKNSIVNSKYYSEQEIDLDGDGEKDVPENWESTTLGELAVYIKDYLYMNGEPVMTSQEEEYLLAVYGRQLPVYLPSHQLEAVKYLMARGILSTEADFKKNVTGAELMMYLARAKDSASRLTFKEINIEYDKDLIKSGYFPTEVVSTDATMYNAKWTRPNKASTDYYDYFVKVTDATRFRDAKGRVVDGLYVSDTFNSTSDYKYPNSEYLGIENGFYHFRIPVNIATDVKACKQGYITINSGNSTDLPGNIKLEYGGGWYTEFVDDNTSNDVNNRSYSSKRIPFSLEDGEEYIDEDMKLTAMNDLDTKIYLKKSNEIVYTFETNDVSVFKWYGESIGTDTSKECYYKEGSNGSKIVTIKMHESTMTAAKILKQRLTVDSTGGSVIKFPAYMNTENNILVSKSFLDQYFGNCTVTSMEGSPGVYELRFNSECILIDTKLKRVVSGQSIKEFDANDKSPLLIKYSDGESLIDYRCLQGIINDYLVLDDNQTGVKAISASVRRSSNGFKPFVQTNIYPLLGQDTLSQARINSDGYMSLEASYNQSNFLLYTKATESTKYTVLLVFKPKVEGFETSDAVKEELLKSYSIKLGDSENCTMYRLSDNNTAVTGDTKGLYKTLKVGDVIKYSSVDGYMYKIPDIKTWDFKTYYEGENCETSVLPIVSSGNMYIDLNANIDQNAGPYKFPGAILNSSVANRLGTTNGIAFNKDGAGYYASDVSMGDLKNSIQYAPMGLFLNFYNIEEKTAKDIVGEKVLYGSMAGIIKSNSKILGEGSEPYLYEVNGNMSLGLSGEEKYYLLNFGNVNGSTVYMYKTEGSSTMGEYKKSGLLSGLDKFIMSLYEKNIFDWGKFNLLQTFRNVDDILTLTYIFLLNLVPRIMIMDFLALATLSFVAKYPVVQYFCNKFIDIYKVLSLWQLDVNTIEVEQIWKSTFWAMVILGMMQQESLIHLLQWFDELILAIVSS